MKERRLQPPAAPEAAAVEGGGELGAEQPMESQMAEGPAPTLGSDEAVSQQVDQVMGAPMVPQVAEPVSAGG